MDATLLGGLLVLALIDSTSIGTLVIPIWLLLSAARPPVRRLLGYLATIAGFYLAVGVGLVLVADAGLRRFGDLADGPAVLWVQLLVGVGLFALSWRYDSGRRRRRGEPDRATRWRDRVLHDPDASQGLVRLALTAGALELLTMLPYLAAVGLLASAGLSEAWYLPLLAAYCLVMVLPALALVGLRVVVQDRLQAGLGRLDGLLSRHADSAIGWVMAIAGFLIARDAAARLWWPQLLGPA
jgi:Sap, sulfolipid-1-addressing protein